MGVQAGVVGGVEFAEAVSGLAELALEDHGVDDGAAAPLGIDGVALGFGVGVEGGLGGVEGGGAGGGGGLGAGGAGDGVGDAGDARGGQGEEVAEGGGEGVVVGGGEVVLVGEAVVDGEGGVGVGADGGFFAGGFGGEGPVGGGAEDVALGVVGLRGLLVGDLLGGEDFFGRVGCWAARAEARERMRIAARMGPSGDWTSS